MTVFTEVVSLGLVKTPGEMADIAVGEGQSIPALPLGFGGPYVGLFTCKSKYHAADAGPPVRRDSGCGRQARLRADAVDARASTSVAIRRRSKTSATELRPVHAGVHGAHDAAGRQGPDASGDAGTMKAACDLADALSAVKGVASSTSRYFNEIAFFETSKPADQVLAALEKQDVIGGVRASACSRAPGWTTSSSRRPPSAARIRHQGLRRRPGERRSTTMNSTGLLLILYLRRRWRGASMRRLEGPVAGGRTDLRDRLDGQDGR